jgi:hypothetical protein
MGELIPMSNFKFVTQNAIRQLEIIAEDVKKEILEMSQKNDKPY